MLKYLIVFKTNSDKCVYVCVGQRLGSKAESKKQRVRNSNLANALIL